jgi:hypothetical protein
MSRPRAAGLLDWLTSNDPAAKALRDVSIFKVVPMLNPDGVFLGNYRCSWVGTDLNRQWGAPGPDSPELVAAKKLVEAAGEEAVDVFVDIHSHSANLNGFMYCNSFDDPARLEQEIMLPRLLDARSSVFSLAHSKFCRDPSKAGSGRRGATGRDETHCYTLEVSTSAFGPSSALHYRAPLPGARVMPDPIQIQQRFCGRDGKAGKRGCP